MHGRSAAPPPYETAGAYSPLSESTKAWLAENAGDFLEDPYSGDAEQHLYRPTRFLAIPGIDGGLRMDSAWASKLMSGEIARNHAEKAGICGASLLQYPWNEGAFSQYEDCLPAESTERIQAYANPTPRRKKTKEAPAVPPRKPSTKADKGSVKKEAVKKEVKHRSHPQRLWHGIKNTCAGIVYDLFHWNDLTNEVLSDDPVSSAEANDEPTFERKCEFVFCRDARPMYLLFMLVGLLAVLFALNGLRCGLRRKKPPAPQIAFVPVWRTRYRT